MREASTTMGCGASSARTVLEPRIFASPKKTGAQPTDIDPGPRGTSSSSWASGLNADLSAAGAHVMGTWSGARLQSADANTCSPQCDVLVPVSRRCDDKLVAAPEVLWAFFSGEVPASCEIERSSLGAQCPDEHQAACDQPAAHSCGEVLHQARDGLLQAGVSAKWPIASGLCAEGECIPWCLATRLRRHHLSRANDEFQIMLDDLRAAAAADSRLAELQALLSSVNCLPASRRSHNVLPGQHSPAKIQTDTIDHGWRALSNPPIDSLRSPTARGSWVCSLPHHPLRGA